VIKEYEYIALHVQSGTSLCNKVALPNDAAMLSLLNEWNRKEHGRWQYWCNLDREKPNGHI
jgi:hypothetical protein